MARHLARIEDMYGNSIHIRNEEEFIVVGMYDDRHVPLLNFDIPQAQRIENGEVDANQ